MSTRSLQLIVLAALTLGGLHAQAQFTKRNVSLYKNFVQADFGAPVPASGNDCWGYVAPSGREYALMGLSNQIAFVEVTNPASPRIVTKILHSNSLWAGVKVYKSFAYVSNETGGGIQVINMTNIDAGAVTLVRSLTDNGLRTTHTVTINTDSGYLYLNGANINNGGLVVYSLADPANPVFVGFGPNVYTHESQVVTYTEGPYAGKEIAFCYNGTTGFDIVDVTNKSSMVRISRLVYDQLGYCHQGWLSTDRKFVFMNDEFDETNFKYTATRSIVINVENLSAPFLATTFTSGQASIDHNEYVRGHVLYQSNYTSGLRIFNVRNPIKPVEVGFFDTYPASFRHDDGAFAFNGTWSNFPFFPSGTVIVSDIDRAMFILDTSAAERCVALDINSDGFANGDDFDSYVAAFEAGTADADYDENGSVNGDDFDKFVLDFQLGCGA